VQIDLAADVMAVQLLDVDAQVLRELHSAKEADHLKQRLEKMEKELKSLREEADKLKGRRELKP
jgi:hypothetical protein